jgi:putative transposase
MSDQLIMPRRQRCVLAGVPQHVTQRGVDRCPVFEAHIDRSTYIRLLRENLAPAGVRLLGWCLMTHHVHLVALPETPESLALLLRRLHGRYAQYCNVRCGRTATFGRIVTSLARWTPATFGARFPTSTATRSAPA